jgi:hypothetical protein
LALLCAFNGAVDGISIGAGQSSDNIAIGGIDAIKMVAI